MSLTFEYPIIIREHHLDTFGHVNNATYLEIFEEARWEFITMNGYDLNKIKETGFGPVVLEINIKFLRELGVRKSVIVHSQNLSYEGKVSKLRQWIEDQDGQIYCDAEFKFGLFDVKTRKLVAPTPEWLKAIGMSF